MNKGISLAGYRDINGKFERLPGKRQKTKLDELLRILSEKNEQGKNYSEAEVNAILDQHHSFNDPATLRRLLYGTNILDRTRNGRSYWLTSKD